MEFIKAEWHRQFEPQRKHVRDNRRVADQERPIGGIDMKLTLELRSKILNLKLGPFRALLRSERGQSLVELALLTPLLLILIIGVVEMGRYASLGILVGNAARA